MYFHIWVSVSICYDRSLTLRQHLNEGVNKETDFVTKWEHVFVTCLSCLQNVFSLVKEVSVFLQGRHFCWKKCLPAFPKQKYRGKFWFKEKRTIIPTEVKYVKSVQLFWFFLGFFFSSCSFLHSPLYSHVFNFVIIYREKTRSCRKAGWKETKI